MEAAARPVAAPPATTSTSASTDCRACEGVECGPGESCYVHEDGTTSCFPSGRELSGWTECPRPDDDEDDDGNGDDGDGDEDGGEDEGGEDEGEEEGEDGDGEGDEDGEGDDEGEDEEGDGDDDTEDEDGEGDDEEEDDGGEEGAEDGWDAGGDEAEGEPGAGGCAGLPEWPDAWAGRFNAIAELVDLGAAILGRPSPPVTLASGDYNPNIIAQAAGGEVQLNPECLEGDSVSFEEWIETALHEMYHLYQDDLASAYRYELDAHRRELLRQGINYRHEVECVEWGAELDVLRDFTRPDDPALSETWDYLFDRTWRIRRQDYDDLLPAPGKLSDTPVPEAERAVYESMAPERQAREFAQRTMRDYGLSCKKPGDVKESAGRSQ